ncbi:MAG TPA: outer membrane beta-barrel protein [Spirochaetota bacterium]|nr:outer membrane beta-barrel protein [Spirochaetota bacterium]HPJ40498.1 outer membrane beta-barrel protein [Spirochaetota bacterium]
MFKKVFTCITMIFLCLPVSLRADDIFGLGIHLGAQHNVGYVGDQDSSMLTDPQNSMLLGLAVKVNASFFFIRTGFDTTFLLNQGKVVENSSQIEKYKINYVAVPFFLGLRFPIRDRGEFYMGGGMAYFLGSGEVTLTTGATEDISSVNYGYGFITGIQFSVLPDVRFYMEWEYFDARSGAVLKTQGAYAWDNFYIDYTGHRILLGVMYYLL